MKSSATEKVVWVVLLVAITLQISKGVVKQDGPVPIPGEGMRVLMFENRTVRPTLPPAQVKAMDSGKVRDWLNQYCNKQPDGSIDWRLYDDTQEFTQEDKKWVDGVAKAREFIPKYGLPQIIICNGKRWYAGPLPPNETELIALLEKHKPNVK